MSERIYLSLISIFWSTLGNKLNFKIQKVFVLQYKLISTFCTIGGKNLIVQRFGNRVPM